MLPVSISLDKDLIKIKDCQKAEFAELSRKSDDLVCDKQERIKRHTTELSYDDVFAYDNKTLTHSIRHNVPSDPQYSLGIAFTKVNDNIPEFWQNLKHVCLK
ncbi:MAG: hypothetical protein ACR5K2_01565 [Wolbachia sp.]